MHACLLCHSPLRRVLASVDAKTRQPLTVQLCETCGLVQQTPMPSEEELRVYYSHHYRQDYKQTYSPKPKYVLRAGLAAKSRFEFLRRVIPADFFSGRPKMLDIGAGGGEVVYLANKIGLDARGIEPNQGYSEFARDNYGITVETKHLDQLADEKFDLITLFHVLEHMPNPVKVMQRLAELLNPNGFLMIEVPNIEQADASPANIFFKAHLYYLSASTLKAIASPYFDPVFVEDSGNLRMLLRKRAQTKAMQLPSAAEVAKTKTRLTQKGWLEYLGKGGGWAKPFRRITQAFRESRIKGMQPRAILDLVLR